MELVSLHKFSGSDCVNNLEEMALELEANDSVCITTDISTVFNNNNETDINITTSHLCNYVNLDVLSELITFNVSMDFFVTIGQCGTFRSDVVATSFMFKCLNESAVMYYLFEDSYNCNDTEATQTIIYNDTMHFNCSYESCDGPNSTDYLILWDSHSETDELNCSDVNYEMNDFILIPFISNQYSDNCFASKQCDDTVSMQLSGDLEKESNTVTMYKYSDLHCMDDISESIVDLRDDNICVTTDIETVFKNIMNTTDLINRKYCSYAYFDIESMTFTSESYPVTIGECGSMRKNGEETSFSMECLTDCAVMVVVYDGLSCEGTPKEWFLGENKSTFNCDYNMCTNQTDTFVLWESDARGEEDSSCDNVDYTESDFILAPFISNDYTYNCFILYNESNRTVSYQWSKMLYNESLFRNESSPMIIKDSYLVSLETFSDLNCTEPLEETPFEFAELSLENNSFCIGTNIDSVFDNIYMSTTDEPNIDKSTTDNPQETELSTTALASDIRLKFYKLIIAVLFFNLI
jgi:hypothetical protein